MLWRKPLLFKYARVGSKLEGVWHMESISSTHVVIVRNAPTFHDTHIVDHYAQQHQHQSGLERAAITKARLRKLTWTPHW